MKDKTGEGKVNLDELEKLVETPHHFFLRLKSGVSIIFPKNKISDKTAFLSSFQAIGLEIEEDLDWERKFVGLPNLFAKSSTKN